MLRSILCGLSVTPGSLSPDAAKSYVRAYGYNPVFKRQMDSRVRGNDGFGGCTAEALCRHSRESGSPSVFDCHPHARMLRIKLRTHYPSLRRKPDAALEKSYVPVHMGTILFSRGRWIPACAGMTDQAPLFRENHQASLPRKRESILDGRMDSRPPASGGQVQRQPSGQAGTHLCSARACPPLLNTRIAEVSCVAVPRFGEDGFPRARE